MVLGISKASPLPVGNESELCEKFASFFTEKISKIRCFLDSQPVSPMTYDVFKGTFFDMFSNVTIDEVTKVITSSSSKSCTLDPIPTPLFKECLDIVMPFVTSIVNASLSTGSFTSCFKQAIVRPSLKNINLDVNVFSNYRPVSNLPFLSKVLEKIAIRQLLKHIENNGLQEVYQSAYKAMHSTETALLKVTSDILETIDRKEVCLLTLLDLSAAFDTIDHEILLQRLNITFGLSGNVLKWFRSYLTGRFQTVGIGRTFSKQQSVEYGVPQGSVLGPILFTIYTQPLAKIFKQFQMMYHLYADDTQIYISGKVENIQNLIDVTCKCVDAVKSWMTTNKLKLNDDKTNIILIRHDNFQHEASHFDKINLNENAIVISKIVKNLGVMFDDSMSMRSAVSSLCKSMYFQIRKIGNVRQYLTENVTKQLISSLVLSKMDYCNSLYAGLPDEIIGRIQKVQNNAARVIFKKRKRDHVTPLMIELHWLPVKQRIVYKICVIVYKSLNGISPSYLTSKLHLYTPTRSLRSSSDKTTLVQPDAHYKYFGHRSFSYLGPLRWNNLPRHIREAESLTVFKKKLKHHLFTASYM